MTDRGLVERLSEALRHLDARITQTPDDEALVDAAAAVDYAISTLG